MNTNLQKKASVNVVAYNGQQKENLSEPKKVRFETLVIPTSNLIFVKKDFQNKQIIVEYSESDRHKNTKSIEWIVCDNNSNVNSYSVSELNIIEINNRPKIITSKDNIYSNLNSATL